jgi:hypothetical protein
VGHRNVNRQNDPAAEKKERKEKKKERKTSVEKDDYTRGSVQRNQRDALFIQFIKN